ncbi:hypothetical protein [Bailinhaonella thermotolerans]|uniref:Tetratricopeptide repeat protein n=1 Tax=Bailinhaonella thermotolerans TaxID=1070861 RepID=A0A3A4B4X8_9ACTN|nr:hypothetical protein [Bailinhaonella thermotolerans]RJL33387.1 hypothetical protein D5H75_11390 [Bailinhaonella thermotolerans]
MLRAAFRPEDVGLLPSPAGELALRAGDLDRAEREYAAAARAVSRHLPSAAGRARVAAARGDRAGAVTRYRSVVERLPPPQYLVEYGEALAASGGSPAEAWRLLAGARRVQAAAGVRDDLTWAEYEADHGDPMAAVRHARAEYARHPNPVAADALAWALHRAGVRAEALRFSREATRTGWRNALLLYHRAEIEKAAGLDDRASRAASRAADPRFDPRLPALARPS